MKIALVGCGGISSCHFAAIEKLKDKGVSLAAVCDIIEERAEKCAQKYGCKAYTDYDEMLEKRALMLFTSAHRTIFMPIWRLKHFKKT